MFRSPALLVLFAPGLLTGCKLARMEMASRAQNQMVGLSKEEVLNCMCAPAAKETAESKEVWTYPSGGDLVSYGSGFAQTTGSASAYSTGSSA